jgi:hypothetical protein
VINISGAYKFAQTMSKSILSAVLLINPLALGVSQVLAEVVYDSSPGPGQSSLGCCGNPTLAQTITLAGNARRVTEFEFFMNSSGPSTFTLQFYNVGEMYEPTTLFRESPILPYPSSLPNPQTVTVSVPSVYVPDTFAWGVFTPSRNNNSLGFGTDQASVGMTLPGWFYAQEYGFWSKHTSWRLGARLHAVPEPRSVSLLALIPIGGTLVRGRSRVVV